MPPQKDHFEPKISTIWGVKLTFKNHRVCWASLKIMGIQSTYFPDLGKSGYIDKNSGHRCKQGKLPGPSYQRKPVELFKDKYQFCILIY